MQIANPPPRPLVWCSPHPAPYAPALVNAGIDLRRVWVVRTRSESDTVWAAAECLRCKGVGAVFAEVERLSTIEARRLQLAAEEGGGVGILLRPARAALMHYAAATRWLVRPWPGERTIQRFKVELLHGHGGRIGQSIVLEISRETDHVRAVGAVAGGSGKAAVAAAG